MSDKDTGGSAFPIDIESKQYGTGMTLRDYFAAKAIPVAWDAYDKGYFKGRFDDSVDDIAKCAYQIADAMLKARGE